MGVVDELLTELLDELIVSPLVGSQRSMLSVVGSGGSKVWVIARVGENAVSALETIRKAVEGMKGRTGS